MKHFKIISILFVTLSVLWSCVPQEIFKPIADQSEPQNFFGIFVIMPPQGQDWYEVLRKGQSLAYGKKLESSRHTFIASVHVSKTDRIFKNEEEFLSFIKDATAKDTDPTRFNVHINKEEINKTYGDYCTKFHLKAEDKGKGTIESNGYRCLHPKHQHLLITIEYSERTDGINVGSEIRNEGEQFINSLKIL